jgi:hypothetical protein
MLCKGVHFVVASVQPVVFTVAVLLLPRCPTCAAACVLLLQVMAVSVRGKVYKLRVRSGPEGKEDFKRQIRQLLGFTQDMDFDVIFE